MKESYSLTKAVHSLTELLLLDNVTLSRITPSFTHSLQNRHAIVKCFASMKCDALHCDVHNVVCMHPSDEVNSLMWYEPHSPGWKPCKPPTQPEHHRPTVFSGFVALYNNCIYGLSGRQTSDLKLSMLTSLKCCACHWYSVFPTWKILS